MPGYDSNDYAASVVLSDVLSSQRGDLYALVPAGQGPGRRLQPQSRCPRPGLGYAVAAFPQGANPQPLVDEVRKILAEDVKKGFPSDLVEAAKRQEVTKAGAAEELRVRPGHGLVAGGGGGGPAARPRTTSQAIQRVTVDDVNHVARRYLDLDHAIVAILTPEPSGKPVASKACRRRGIVHAPSTPSPSSCRTGRPRPCAGWKSQSPPCIPSSAPCPTA